MSVKVPEGMSSVDVFHALYTNAQVIGYGKLHPAAGKIPTSPWNVVQLYQSSCRKGSCDYVRGKAMKVNFTRLGENGAEGYDQKYGKGSAQKAIDAYYKTRKLLDPQKEYSLFDEPCKFFTSYWKERTPLQDRIDIETQFERCAKKEDTMKKVEARIDEINANRSQTDFQKCEASYAITSPPVNYIKHNAKPCSEVIQHLTSLLTNTNSSILEVADLNICHKHSWFRKVCWSPGDSIPLQQAIRVLQASNAEDASDRGG